MNTPLKDGKQQRCGLKMLGRVQEIAVTIGVQNVSFAH